MEFRGTAVVSTFDVGGTTFAAVWDGGDFVNVHVVENGAPTVCVDRWHVADKPGGTTLPDCTPAVLEQIVVHQLANDELVAEALDLAADYLAFTERAGTLPRFSAN